MDSTKVSCRGYLVTKAVFEGTEDAGCSTGLCIKPAQSHGQRPPEGQQENVAHLHPFHPSITALWQKRFSQFLFHLTRHRRAVKTFVLVLPQFF